MSDNNKQAILIMAHNNLWTLKKIIKTLDSKYFDIFVHIDIKSSIEKKDLYNIVNVSKLYIYKEIDVKWGDYSQVECELLLLRESNLYSYSRYHLISGADMPLKSPKYIFEYFEKYKNKEFIHFESKKISKEKEYWINYYYYFRKISRKNKFYKLLDEVSIRIQKLIGIKRTRNKNIKFMTGANWFSITNDFAIYVLNNVEFINDCFKNTRSPDEMFLQTLLYNSNFKNNLYFDKFNNDYTNSISRYIDWKRGNPYIFRLEDYDELLNSNCIFARKFDEKVNKEIIEKIYNNIKKQ